MKTETYKLTDIKAHTEICTNRSGLIRELTVISIAPNNLKLILMNDQFAQYRGYKDRETLIKCMKWGPIYSTMELYFNPITGKVVTFQDTMPTCLN